MLALPFISANATRISDLYSQQKRIPGDFRNVLLATRYEMANYVESGHVRSSQSTFQYRSREYALRLGLKLQNLTVRLCCMQLWQPECPRTPDRLNPHLTLGAREVERASEQE